MYVLTTKSFQSLTNRKPSFQMSVFLPGSPELKIEQRTCNQLNHRGIPMAVCCNRDKSPGRIKEDIFKSNINTNQNLAATSWNNFERNVSSVIFSTFRNQQRVVTQTGTLQLCYNFNPIGMNQVYTLLGHSKTQRKFSMCEISKMSTFEENPQISLYSFYFFLILYL